MIKGFKLLIAGIGISLLALSLSPLSTYAVSPAEQIRKGVNTAAGKDNADKPASLTDLVAKIVNILSVLIGAIAVIMLIFGGFRYVTSAGNDVGVQAAKNTILYAIIGLIIVALAQVIVKFVLTNVGGSTTTNSSSSTAQPSKSGPGSSNDRLPSQKQLLND